jgi:hypothetical protein
MSRLVRSNEFQIGEEGLVEAGVQEILLREGAESILVEGVFQVFELGLLLVWSSLR